MKPGRALRHMSVSGASESALLKNNNSLRKLFRLWPGSVDQIWQPEADLGKEGNHGQAREQGKEEGDCSLQHPLHRNVGDSRRDEQSDTHGRGYDAEDQVETDDDAEMHGIDPDGRNHRVKDRRRDEQGRQRLQNHPDDKQEKVD